MDHPASHPALVVPSHEEVRAFLGAVDTHVRAGAVDHLAAAARTLAPHLPVHVAAESAPGGFLDVVARCLGPERASALRREHRQLLTWLESIVVLQGTRLERAVVSFADLLGRHERTETDLALRCARILGP
jgi:hypothetical protein